MTKELKNQEISIGWDVGGWSGKNHGLCILETFNGELRLTMAEKLTIYAIKEEIEKIIAEKSDTHKITLGIDAPLQFPKLFQEIIKSNPINIFQSNPTQKENPIAWRQTDLFIKKEFGKTPLSPSFSFLTSNATVAITLLGELKSKGIDLSILPFDKISSINAIEVYPGLLKCKKIKSSLAFNVYQKILRESQFQNIEGFEYYFGEAKVKTDVADAVICALYGLGLNGHIKSIPNLETTIPSKYLDICKNEGWIYHPVIS
jgi:hypothetical protein